jgi:hypothetical protein
MTFTDAANGRVTAHLANGFNVVGQQQSSGTHARSGQSRLGTGMAATHHNHIKNLVVIHRHVKKNQSTRYYTAVIQMAKQNGTQAMSSCIHVNSQHEPKNLKHSLTLGFWQLA